MTHRILRTFAGTAVLCATIVATSISGVLAQGQAGQGAGGGQGRGGGPAQNLQVLPKDMPRQELTALMRTFTAALGVECSHCHVGTPAERAKDDLPSKGIARKMIQMTMTINNDMLKEIGQPAAPGAMKVTCFTCHRGQLKPATSAAAGGGFPIHQ